MNDLTVWKALRLATKPRANLRPVDDSHGWHPLAWAHGHDWAGTGSWQQDIEVNRDTAVANWTIWSCASLIASDVSKCGLRVLESRDGIWSDEGVRQCFVSNRPNHFQNRQQFLERWVLSKLLHGNAYILKERNGRNEVAALYVLDPALVQPLIAEDGDVYYQLHRDELNQLRDDFPGVPASEIIHDRFNCIHHPLIGVSPVFACGVAAMQGSFILQNSARFFRNMSRPAGVLTAPGAISDDTANRLKANWQENFSGANIGRTAVLGDGLKYEALGMSAIDAQMVEQAKLSAEMICSTFHVPPWKVGLGALPGGAKAEDMNTIYFSDCLDSLMDAVATLLTDGLGYDGTREAIRFNLDDLLRMDGRTLAEVEGIKVQRGIAAPNESRRKFNLPPVPGGSAPYLQMQNFSLEALAKRDALDDPFAAAASEAKPRPGAPDEIEKRLAAFEERFRDIEQRAGDLQYKGVWMNGELYRRGNLATFAGSLWHCEASTMSKPGTDATWKLAIQRGTTS